MNLWEIFVNKITNPVIIENLSNIALAFFIAFIIAFVLTPGVGKLAKSVGAVDLPAKLRGKKDPTSGRRIHTEIKPKLGGIAMFIGIIASIIITGNTQFLSTGVTFGLIIIFLFGIIDDVIELNSKLSLAGQAIAAFAVVLGGSTILYIDFRFFELDFNWFSDLVFHFGDYTYNFIFPADVITIIWIVGLINVVSWTDGADGVAGSISSISALFMLLTTLLKGDILLASVIAIFMGGVLGVLPYNYNPSKIFYSSSGSFVMGYLLAVFAIWGGARWNVTITILGLFIIDAIFVIYMRIRKHPEVLKNPLRILSISDKNHLHHRLIAAGYSHKVVMLVESSFVFVLGSIAFVFSDLESEYIALVLGVTFLVVAFTVIAFLRKRTQRDISYDTILKPKDVTPAKKIVINIKDENDLKDKEDEKFIY